MVGTLKLVALLACLPTRDQLVSLPYKSWPSPELLFEHKEVLSPFINFSIYGGCHKAMRRFSKRLQTVGNAGGPK